MYRFGLLLVLVRTVIGFSSMTPVSHSPQRPTIPNSNSIAFQLVITAIPRLLSMSIKRLETVHNFCIRAQWLSIELSLYMCIHVLGVQV